MSKFPDTPAFTGFFKPERWEADVPDCEVEGDIPTSLDGAFFRVQPDPQMPPRRACAASPGPGPSPPPPAATSPWRS